MFGYENDKVPCRIRIAGNLNLAIYQGSVVWILNCRLASRRRVSKRGNFKFTCDAQSRKESSQLGSWVSSKYFQIICGARAGMVEFSKNISPGEAGNIQHWRWRHTRGNTGKALCSSSRLCSAFILFFKRSYLPTIITDSARHLLFTLLRCPLSCRLTPIYIFIQPPSQIFSGAHVTHKHDVTISSPALFIVNTFHYLQDWVFLWISLWKLISFWI